MSTCHYMPDPRTGFCTKCMRVHVSPHVVIVETVETTGHGEIRSTTVQKFDSAEEAHRFAVEAVGAKPAPKKVTVAQVVRTLYRPEALEPCCEAEDRGMNGGCRNCGAPSF